MSIEEKTGLKRKIGIWGLTANIVNIIIGAGIFIIPSVIAQKMGASSVVAYLFCGFLIALIMLCFAEAGSKVTVSGGAYIYAETAFGKYPGFIVACLAIAACFLADAVVSNALVDTLGTVFPLARALWARILLLFLIFFGLALINVMGIKQGIGLVKFNTLAKLIPLLLLVTIGWKDVSLANLHWATNPTVDQVGGASLILFFAFMGIETGVVVGGEIINPKKTFPKAIFMSIGIVLILYILIQTVSQGVLGDNLPLQAAAPLAHTANVIFGPIGFTILFFSAAVSMFGNLSGEVLNNPRIIYAMARDNVIPIPILAKVHRKYATPYVSVLIYALIGFCLATFGGFEQLISIATGIMLLQYLGVVLSVLRLRKKQPARDGEFEIPGGLTVPIVSAIIILYFLSNLSQNELMGSMVFIAVISLLYLGIKLLKRLKDKTL